MLCWMGSQQLSIRYAAWRWCAVHRTLFLYICHEHERKSKMEWDKQRKLWWESSNLKNKSRNGMSQTNLLTSHIGFNNWRTSLFVPPLFKKAQVSVFNQTSWFSLWGIHRLVSSKPSKGLSLSSLGTSKN